jgi:tetratricopeptide (TPR) repeat protein
MAEQPIRKSHVEGGFPGEGIAADGSDTSRQSSDPGGCAETRASDLTPPTSNRCRGRECGSRDVVSLVRSIVGPLLVVAAASLPYLGILDAPFVFDDTKLVRDNPLLRVEGAEAFSRLIGIFDVTSRAWAGEEVRENYRPLRFLSYWVDYRITRSIYGDFPSADPPSTVFHVQNIFWHAANALLILAIARRLLDSRSAGFVAALLFAAHPLATEAVTYVSGRRDVLSTLFFLAALWLHARTPASERLPWLSVFLAPLLFAAGYLAKEMVITLPAIVIALDIGRRARFDVRRCVVHILFWAVAAGFVAVTISNKDLIAVPVGGSAGSTFLTAPRYVLRYLGLVLAPVSQSIDYSYDAIPASRNLLEPLSTLPALLAVAGLALVAGLRALLGRGIASWGIAWFLVALLPVLHIVPIPERFAERFAYLPAIGVLLAVVAVWRRWERRSPRIALVGALCVCAVAFVGATLRNRDWTSPLRLWGSAVAAQPRAARAHLAYGNALKDAGRWREAAAHYTTALDLWAKNPAPSSLEHGQTLQARMFRGGVRAVLGRAERRELDGAIDDLRAVLADTDTDGKPIGSSPEYAIVRFELASSLIEADRRAEARDELQRLIALGRPAAFVAQGHYWLGKIAVLDRDIDAAVESFRRAVEVLPKNDRTLFDVSIELADMVSNLAEDHERAWSILESLLLESPDRETRVGIFLRQARILDRQRQVAGAIHKLEEALEVDPMSIPVLVTLAGIESNLGHDSRASELYRRVLAIDRANYEAREGLKALAVRGGIEAQKTVEAKNDEILRGLYSRGRQHRERNEWIAARDVFSQMVRAAANLGNAEGTALGYCELAEIESALGRSKEALRALENAESADPRRADTLLRLGDYHVTITSDPRRARDYFERYLAALPDSEAPEARALFELALLVESDDPHRAVELLLRLKLLGTASRLGPRASDVSARLGMLYAKLGEWKQSYEELESFLQATESDVEIHPYRPGVIRLLQDTVVPALVDAEDLEIPGDDPSAAPDSDDAAPR